MKISLKLNAVQAARAATILAALPTNEELDHTSFNPDQALSLEGDILTYVGQRCPLWADGKGAAIQEILTGLKWPAKAHWTGGMNEQAAREHRAACKRFNAAGSAAFADANVLDYQSNDARLKWWETLGSYLATRGTPEDCLAELAKDSPNFWGEKIFSGAAVTKFPILSDVAEAASEVLASPTRANAQFDVKTIRLARQFISMVSHDVAN